MLLSIRAGPQRAPLPFFSPQQLPAAPAAVLAVPEGHVPAGLSARGNGGGAGKERRRAVPCTGGSVTNSLARAAPQARSDRICIICRDEMAAGQRGYKRIACGHCFHLHCLRGWVEHQQTCPTCRAPIAVNQPAAEHPAAGPQQRQQRARDGGAAGAAAAGDQQRRHGSTPGPRRRREPANGGVAEGGRGDAFRMPAHHHGDYFAFGPGLFPPVAGPAMPAAAAMSQPMDLKTLRLQAAAGAIVAAAAAAAPPAATASPSSATAEQAQQQLLLQSTRTVAALLQAPAEDLLRAELEILQRQQSAVEASLREVQRTAAPPPAAATADPTAPVDAPADQPEEQPQPEQPLAPRQLSQEFEGASTSAMGASEAPAAGASQAGGEAASAEDADPQEEIRRKRLARFTPEANDTPSS